MARTSIGNLYDRRSYLRDGRKKDFYLDVVKMPSIDMSQGDYVQVPPECDNRIDLFSYQQYKTSRLWWIVAMANADIIADPIWDFRSGMTVFVPRNQLIGENFGTNT